MFFIQTSKSEYEESKSSSISKCVTIKPDKLNNIDNIEYLDPTVEHEDNFSVNFELRTIKSEPVDYKFTEI